MRIFKLAAAAGLAAVVTASAAAADPNELVAHATQVAAHMKSDPAFNQAQNMVQNARAVLIVPGLVKGGFIFGAEGGDGVLVKRLGAKSWSSPAFYTMGSASFGLQIGLQKAEIVLLIMSDRALTGIMQNEFKIGAGAGITAITLSSGAEAATSGNGGDIVVWTSATGAYGGLTLNGSVIKPRPEWNTTYYGQSAPVSTILASGVKNPASRPLQAELASIMR
jgi:lipid-binding SYLF domain-containing protein